MGTCLDDGVWSTRRGGLKEGKVCSGTSVPHVCDGKVWPPPSPGSSGASVLGALALLPLWPPEEVVRVCPFPYPVTGSMQGPPGLLGGWKGLAVALRVWAWDLRVGGGGGARLEQVLFRRVFGS